MVKRNLKTWVLMLLMAFVLMSGGCGGSSDGSVSGFAGGSGTNADPWQIATAAQLSEVRSHLDGHFVLTDDIDLSSYSNWTPIGAFVPVSDAPEDQETPVMELAFTGVFDGNGHTISNVTINAPKSNGVGLFGCVADSGSVYDLTVSDVKAQGAMLVAGVIGYGMCSSVEGVRLIGDNEIKGGAMVGGIVGGGFCDIINCEAKADVTLLGDSQYSQCVGVLAGGMKTSDIIDCAAVGNVTVVGTGNLGIGGLAGCAMDSDNVLHCESNVTITVGEKNALVGGLLGYAGRTGDADKLTLISDCSASAVINAPDSAERIGGIVGGGFFAQAFSEYRPEPGAIRVTNCHTDGEISGGSIVGTVLGYAYDNSSVEDCASDMTIDEAAGEQIGARFADIPLDELL